MSSPSDPKNTVSEREFRLLVEGVVDYAIFLVTPDGLISTWNSGAERIKGYHRDEAVGRHIRMFYSPEDQALGVPENALAIAAREGRLSGEGWRVRKDGSRFLASIVLDAIYDDGRLIGFAKITRDVTERNNSQSALLDSERNFRMLVRGVTDYALYMLDPEGNVSSWNSGGESIKGYSPAEIIGQHFSVFYTEADRKRGKPRNALETAKTTGRYEEEGFRVRKDGSTFFASVVIDSIRSDDGRLIGFAKITRDITERRDAQIAIEKMQRQLAEAQKMEALGQLTGGVAHDFNNLLMIISGNLATLIKRVDGDARATRAAESIKIATDRAAALTRQLLTFARRQRVEPRPVKIEDRLDEIREVLVSALRGNIRLETRVAADSWLVKVDPNELEIALLNLVVNARDAMPDGGTVLIRTENLTVGAGDTLPPGDYLSITVADSGVGIPDDILAKVFDPFFTTKVVGKGTGLGLSQVHGFTHQAGGTVRITSTLNKGTLVTLCLPRTSEEAVAPGPRSTMTLTQGDILLVEDNPDVAIATTQLLEELGFEVFRSADAESALEVMGQRRFNALVSDIVMPGRMDGLGLARAVKQSHPALPIVLATGYSDAALETDCEFEILRKPYGRAELEEALSRAVAAAR